MHRTRSLKLRFLTLSAASVAMVCLVATQAGAVAPAKTVPPKQWAKTVCPALADFVSTFQSIDEQVGDAASAVEAQELIISGLEEAIGSADGVIVSVKRAGTPDAKKGKQAAAVFTREFKNIKQSLTGIQTGIDDLSTADLEQFATESQEIRDQAISELDDAFSKFDNIDSKVNKAINADAACRAIGQ